MASKESASRFWTLAQQALRHHGMALHAAGGESATSLLQSQARRIATRACQTESVGVLKALGGRWAAASASQAAQQVGRSTGGWAGLRLYFKRFTSSGAQGPSGQAAAAGAEQAVAAEAAAAAAAAKVSAPVVGGLALSHGLSDSARRQLSWWMGGTAAWVYSMVVLGGVTRLTRSGLSMTDWKFTGERPPVTEEDWAAEFAKYKDSPEFKKVHSRMTVDEFKFIFLMEYGHRMWGRLLGATFLLPATYFAARGYINKALAKRLGLLFFMGGTQGLVGWWMVRSGLVEPQHEWQEPRVSPYRLAAHLVSAFAIYSTLVWTALDLRTPTPLAAAQGVSEAAVKATKRVRGALLPLSALVAVTATSGAFVAGCDAGRAYNTWPLMGDKFIPDEYWDPSRFTWLRNLFENTAAVQFDHRVLATATLFGVLGSWAWVKGLPVPRGVGAAMNMMGAVTALQFGLGVWTLLEYVPVHLGSLHQANALNLFTAVLMALHAARPATPGPLSVAASKLATPLSVALVGAIGVAVTTQK